MQNITSITTNTMGVSITHTADRLSGAGIAAITGTGITLDSTMGHRWRLGSGMAIRSMVLFWCMSLTLAPGVVINW
jgi:hypothetical protein